MKRIFTALVLMCLSLNALKAQDYDVSFDTTPWVATGGSGMTLSDDTLTMIGESGVYKKYSYTLNVDPNIEDLYFTARIYLDNISLGPDIWDTPKMRIENTSGGKLVNWNISSEVDGQWVHTGVVIENFDNLGLSQINIIFGFQNSTGTFRIVDPFVSSSPSSGTYSFPYEVPLDPTVTLDINSSEYHPFQNDLLSTNCHFTWAPYNWEVQGVKDIIYEKFPMENLRFPGGTVANFYNWQTDDFYANSYSANNNTANTGSQDAKVFGYPGYLDVTKTLGGNSTLLFNVFSDDKTLSQARLQSRLDDNLDVKWIEMGNENYFTDQAYGYVDDNELGLNGNGDGEYYDEYIKHTKDLAGWLREIKPDIKVAVNTHDDHWNTPLAAENYYDACVMHNYIFVNSFMVNQYASADFLSAYKTTQNRLDHYVTTFGGDEPVLMSEWGLLSDMPNHFVQVLGSADNFLSIERGNERGIVEQAGIHMLYHGDFIGEGSLIMHDGSEFRLNPIGVMYSKLYEVFKNHNVYDAYSTSAELESDLDAVHAKAIDLGDSIYVFAVNKLPVDAPLNLNIDGANYNGAFKMETYSEDMNSDLYTNYSVNDSPWSQTSGTGIINIPANSISVITIQKSDYESVCEKPNLGDNTNLCGRTSINLNSNVSTTNRTFEWYKDDVLIPSETGATISVNQSGIYKVIADSSGCLREDVISVSDDLPSIYFGTDVELCTVTSLNLDGTINNPEVNYAWTKDGNPITESTGVLFVNEAGTYALTASAGTCNSVVDEIVIVSSMVNVTHDTICSSGSVNLAINDTGNFTWYDQEENGTSINSTLTYSPSISSSTTYYVQDDNVSSYNFGRTSQTGTVYGGTTDYSIWGRTMYMTVEKEFLLESFDVFTNSAVDIQINIAGTGGFDYTFTQSGLANMGNTPITLYPNQVIPAGDFIITLLGTNGKVDVQVSDLSDNVVPGIVEFGGTDGGDHYGFFYNWNISVSNSCARTPVYAVIDPTHTSCPPVDCNGDLGGSAVMDNCGTCTGGNSGNVACTQDCNGDWGGTGVMDNCGTCTGGNSGNVACTQDCNGDWGGTAVMDNCGTCTGGNSGNVACTQDCNGDWGGSAIMDNCGTCTGGNSGNVACTQDCNGDWGGTAYTDGCSSCVGGNTGQLPCDNDCAGVPGGSAYFDNCGTCVEGTTGNVACTQDCNGDWGGTAVNDNCSICVGGNTGQTACTQSCDGTWGSDAFVDSCGTCVGGNSGVPESSACKQDCNNDWGGTASIDLCSECSGGNTRVTPNSSCTDCNGDPNGLAAIDNCSVCSGGNTGIAVDDCLTPISTTNENQIHIYPNPTEGIIHLSEPGSWKVYNSLGNLVLSGEGESISLEGKASGLYIVIINEQVFRIDKI